MTGDPSEAVIEQAILTLTAARAPRTICPSEVARSLMANEAAWRALMPTVREAAGRLADAGLIEVTQRGVPVDPRTAGGPIRLSARPARSAKGGR